MNTTSLICGIAGQDGAYVAQLLLSKGHLVIETGEVRALKDFMAEAFRREP